MTRAKTKTKTDIFGNTFVVNYEGPWSNYFDSEGNILHVDIDGKVIERPKSKYPYSYSSFCIFNACQEKLATADKEKHLIISVDSDRLFMCDPDRYNFSSLKVFGNKGQNFNTRTPELIEKFLQTYYSDKSIILLKIIEGCNVSNGFPFWHFKYEFPAVVSV
jgi:hypothetical protein